MAYCKILMGNFLYAFRSFLQNYLFCAFIEIKILFSISFRKITFLYLNKKQHYLITHVSKIYVILLLFLHYVRLGLAGTQREKNSFIFIWNINKFNNVSTKKWGPFNVTFFCGYISIKERSKKLWNEFTQNENLSWYFFKKNIALLSNYKQII
jgi:hypothetical protein